MPPATSSPAESEMDCSNPAPDCDWHDARRSEHGQGMVEYALILILIAIFVILTVQVLGHQTSNLFSNVSNGLNQ